jgi:serine/threonine protein kinase
MGDVWLAVDPLIGRQVALKRIRAKHSNQELRFMAEAQIAGQLEHPSIVPVHDLGKGDDGLPFYIMKFVRGDSFKKVIQDFHAQRKADKPGWPVRWRQLLDVFVDLCEAVAYAHSRGVIHRDLKPDNVMVGPFGETMVLDWGLAKLQNQPEAPGTPTYMAVTSSGHSADTQAGSVIGSPPYMPPEMAEGHADQAGPPADVYLLGATLYSILTNEPPRRGSSHAEIVELARTVPPVPPRQKHPWVPRPLEAICMRAMAMRIEDRY